MPNEQEISEALEACFGGHIDRDCDSCPAHPVNGGTCCFADPNKFDVDDRECRVCIHGNNCCEMCDPQEEARPPVYTVRPRGAAPTRQPAGHVAVRTAATPYNMNVRAPVGKDSERESGRTRFMKDTVWGAGEGFFKQAYEFFRTHRLR